MNATITPADLTAGTVFTFTKDLTFINSRWTERTVGTHFVVGGLSESGYTFSAFNTRTGRRDDMMAEGYVFEAMRIIAGPAAAPDCECACECDVCWPQD
jgi:hypothetical protein